MAVIVFVLSELLPDNTSVSHADVDVAVNQTSLQVLLPLATDNRERWGVLLPLINNYQGRENLLPVTTNYGVF